MDSNVWLNQIIKAEKTSIVQEGKCKSRFLYDVTCGLTCYQGFNASGLCQDLFKCVCVYTYI